MSLSALESYKILIRENHMDTYGHVNNATYLELYEEARWQILTERGYGFKTVHQLKVGPVILEVNLKFKKEIHLREVITIQTEVLNYQGKIAQMGQKMIKENGDIASEAVFTFGLFDMRERRLIEPTPEWKQALGLEV